MHRGFDVEAGEVVGPASRQSSPSPFSIYLFSTFRLTGFSILAFITAFPGKVMSPVKIFLARRSRLADFSEIGGFRDDCGMKRQEPG